MPQSGAKERQTSKSNCCQTIPQKAPGYSRAAEAGGLREL